MNIKVLSTVHDLHPHEAKKAWYKMLKHKLFYHQVWKSFEKCDYVVTNSENQFKAIRQSYSQKKSYYHPFPTLVTDQIRKGQGIVEELSVLDKPYILFFGRIEEYKGVHLLYDAFMNSSALLDNYYLVIAGQGDNSRMVSNKCNNVLFLNRFIKDEEIKNLFQNASCVVFPYLSATQSGVLSLAFFFQCPTLTSDVPFFNEIITRSGTGLVFKAGDSMDLQNKLEALIAADKTIIKEKQLIYYYCNYDQTALRESLLNIYQSVLEQ